MGRITLVVFLVAATPVSALGGGIYAKRKCIIDFLAGRLFSK